MYDATKEHAKFPATGKNHKADRQEAKRKAKLGDRYIRQSRKA